MSKRAWLAIVLVLFVVAIIFLSGCSGNYKIFDTVYEFDYALVYHGTNVMRIEIERWKDFTDGEQLQIWSTDGKVYLVNSVNTILVKD